MRNFIVVKGPRLWFIVITGILLLSVGVAYLQFRSHKKPISPTVPVVSSCKPLEPGMRRMGNQYGFQFDVLVKDFTIREGTTDAAPLVHGFDLKPKNSVSGLDISFGGDTMESMAVDPARVFSSHVEQRSIFDDKGHMIGEDYWGYLNSGERWRRVRLSGWVAKYGFVKKKDAELFDQVINSVCILSAPGQ